MYYIPLRDKYITDYVRGHSSITIHLPFNLIVMSQHNIHCPKCNITHEVDALRSGGVVSTILSIQCGFQTSNKAEIAKLLGLEEVHRQRIANYEMPAVDY